MIFYCKTIDGRMHHLKEYEPGCWINVIEPTDNELLKLINDYNLDADFVNAALDEEESSRIEKEDGTTLIILDIPVVEKVDAHLNYYTCPIGIIMTDTNVITISLKENSIISEFNEGVVKGVNTAWRTQFVLLFILRASKKYLQYLKQIDRISDHVERKLRKSMRNDELIQLLDISKSLVYFSSSLKANEITLNKLSRGRLVKLYEDDEDLLDDVMIEIQQAIEMSTIQLNILSNMMDVFSSIISNNLNNVMKILASITILMAIPTIISGFWGMNVFNMPSNNFWFPVALAGVILLIAAGILLKKKLL